MVTSPGRGNLSPDGACGRDTGLPQWPDSKDRMQASRSKPCKQQNKQMRLPQSIQWAQV